MTNGTNGSNNGVHRDAAIVGEDGLLWDGLSPRATDALAQPLDPSLVSRRKGRGNRSFDYIEGHVAIAQANAVFGFGGWGYDLVGDVTLREIENIDPKTGEVKRTHAYAATVRVNVPGAPSRTDVGFHAVADETAEGHETAFKGAVTDGMKRALRSFGDQFGNGLYGDTPAGSEPAPRVNRTQAKASASAPRKEGGGASGPGRAGRRPTDAQDKIEESRVRAMRKGLIELGGMQGFDEAGVRAAVRRQTGAELEEVPTSKLEKLVEAATLKLQKMQEAQAA